MNRIIHNKNYSGETQINSSVFDSSDYKYGEIVVCCDIDNPGLFIYTKGSNGETKIQKINSIDNIFFEGNLSSGATGEIAEGDSIYVAISKLKNEINSIIKGEGDSGNLINKIILTLGIKDDGSFDFWSEYPGLNHVKDAKSFVEVIEQLDKAIDSTTGDLDEKIKKEYTKAISDALEEALKDLKYDFTCESGSVITAISQENGKVSVSATTLSVKKDDTGLLYELKLGDDVFGTIDIPKDQFLKNASFISAATVGDVAQALTEGQTIEEGKPYIKFEWIIDDVKKPTYVDVSGLVNIYTAKDIEFSDSFSGDTTETGITGSDNVETAIEKVITKITEIVKEIHENKVSSESGSIVISGTPDGGTVVDVYVDNDTIVKSDLVSTKGQLSVSLNVDTKTNSEGNIKTEYTLKTSGGTEYGKIYETRDILSGDGATFVNVTNERVQVGEGVSLNTDKNTISLTINENIGSVNGPSVVDGNGLTTAWAVKNFVQAGIYDGDMVMVGRNELLPWDNWIGRIHFANGSAHPDDVKYNTVHQAFLITDTNFIELAKAIGFDDDGQYAHHYVQNRYSTYRYFSGATTVMGAIELLDDNIAVEWADQGGKEGYAKKAIRTRETGCDATGYYSFAEGHDTEASGEGSHSEGIETVAEGKGSHAEGNGTTASGENSHAEGSGSSTDVNANSAHAEGQNTTANGFASHSEGSNTTAGGQYSHAEGFHTEASGDSSHASGVYTKATNKGETAVGKYNQSNTDTIFSVGVGSSESDRKNALEIRGNGTAARAYGEAIVTTKAQANSETAIGKLVDSQSMKDWFESLDSSSATTDDHYFMTGITITDGYITAIGQNHITSAETKVTVAEAESANTEELAVYSITTGGTNGHAVTYKRTDRIANATHADAAGKTDKTLTAHYGATGNTDATFNGSEDVTINIPNNTDQLVNGARYVSSVEAIPYKISVVTTAPSSPASDTIYILI